MEIARLRHSDWIPFALLAGAALIAACTGVITRSVEAVFLEIEGSATLNHREEVRAGARWGSGGVLTVGDSSRASVQLLPGALVELDANSTAHLVGLRLTKDGSSAAHGIRRSLQLELERGVVLLVIRFESKAGDVMIQTPHASITTERGGTFRVEVSSDTSRFTSINGELLFNAKSGEGSTRLRAGHFSEVPGAVPPQLIETSAIAQSDADKSLELERKLLKLESDQRLARRPWQSR